MKPKIVIAVLSGAERDRWINPHLFDSLLSLQLDGRFSMTTMVTRLNRWEFARNCCVTYARDNGADFLVMVDNDMILPEDFADVLHQVTGPENCPENSDKTVVGIPSASVWDSRVEFLTPQDNGIRDGGFRQTGVVGSGVLVISAEVWRVIPRGPWFRWLTKDDETLSVAMSEDYFFCNLMMEHGIKVWAHQSLAGHLKTVDITKIKMRTLEDVWKRKS